LDGKSLDEIKNKKRLFMVDLGIMENIATKKDFVVRDIKYI